MQHNQPPLTTHSVDPIANILPRGFHEREAAKYIGMSVSFLRKDRMSGVMPGRTSGPRWARVGKRVIYLKEDLDQWLDTHVVHKTNPKRCFEND